MSEYTTIENMNNVRVLQRVDGKFGVEDVINNKITWRFRTLEGAMENAKLMSDENDQIDAYELSTK